MVDELEQRLLGILDVYEFYIHGNPEQYIVRHRSKYNMMDRWMMTDDPAKRIELIKQEAQRIQEMIDGRCSDCL